MGRILNKINDLVHPIMLRYLDASYVRKNKHVRRLHPELYVRSNALDVKGHVALWEKVKKGKVDPSWYVMHSNISGVPDIRYVPENVYFPYIEPVLNNLEMASAVADKNLLQKYIDPRNCPVTILRYINGVFMNSEYNIITVEQAKDLLRSNKEVVLKPAVDSSGGLGVELRKNDVNPVTVEELLSHRGTSYIVQLKVNQHRQTAQFNSSSVNTCRVMTLRCPWDTKVVHLKTMLRIGRGDSFCDNMMRGGLCVGVDDSGRLGKYAFDYDGQRFSCLPGKDIVFEKTTLPFFPKMLEFALSVAKQIPYMNILSFDLVVDESDNVICLEMNTAGQGITQLQYDGVPLFHKYTNDIIEYCIEHSDYNQYRHLRTFYW